MIINVCSGPLDTKLEYQTKLVLKAQTAQDKKDKKIEAEAKTTKENELLNTKKDDFKSDNLVDILA